MLIEDIIDQLSTVASLLYGEHKDAEARLVVKASECIRMLWEVAKDTTNSKYKRKIDEMMGDEQ